MTKNKPTMGTVYESEDPTDTQRTVVFKLHPPKSGELFMKSGAPLLKGVRYVLDGMGMDRPLTIEIMTDNHRRIRRTQPQMDDDWRTEHLFGIVD